MRKLRVAIRIGACAVINWNLAPPGRLATGPNGSEPEQENAGGGPDSWRKPCVQQANSALPLTLPQTLPIGEVGHEHAPERSISRMTGGGLSAR